MSSPSHHLQVRNRRLYQTHPLQCLLPLQLISTRGRSQSLTPSWQAVGTEAAVADEGGAPVAVTNVVVAGSSRVEGDAGAVAVAVT